MKYFPGRYVRYGCTVPYGISQVPSQNKARLLFHFTEHDEVGEISSMYVTLAVFVSSPLASVASIYNIVHVYDLILSMRLPVSCIIHLNPR